MTILLGSLAAFVSCGSDDGDGDGGGGTESNLDPNVFCDEYLCSTNGDLKQQCINAFNSCLANEPDANDDECAATALLICKP